MSNVIKVYTDGSANNNPKSPNHGLGGIGVYMQWNGHEMSYSEGFKNTTSARMEIQAIIIALRKINKKDIEVIIYCDNEYCVKSLMLGWVFGWEEIKWIGRKNADLWKEFLIEYRKFGNNLVKLQWVKGHDKGNCIGNEIADELAGKEYKKLCDANNTATV